MTEKLLSHKITSLEESQTLAFTSKARVMTEAGIDVVRLTAGEPDFPTPRHVKDAAILAIEANFTRYTANEGITELLDAIRRKFKRDNELSFERDQILVSSGAKHVMYNLLQAICDPGDEVIILSPYYVSYPAMVRLVGGEPVIVSTDLADGFRPHAEAIRKAITPRTKALILNSPCNPTGVVHTRKELEAIASLCRETVILVISDEIYEKIIFDGRRHESIGSFPGLADQVVTVNGVSKSYAMPGWRIGYCGGPREIVQAAAKVQSQTTSNANSIAQKATVAALDITSDAMAEMAREFERRRNATMEELRLIRNLKVVNAEGAMFYYFDASAFYGKKTPDGPIRSSLDLAQYLLEHHHVAVVPGGAFGDDRCIRISFAAPVETCREGVRRIKKGLEVL